MSGETEDTIVALATASGSAGVGIVRVSGPLALEIGQKILGFSPTPRYAHYCPFRMQDGQQLDEGIALFFDNPNSFTGEDVLELQGHGGPVLMDMLIREILGLGARLAEPGEFSKRAFLNDKLDLLQAEAIADLINSQSERAVRCAMRSLQGDFSKEVNKVLEGLIKLRMFVEAAIDFPEEEIDFIADSDVKEQLELLNTDLSQLTENAGQGALMTEGIKVVIAGKPNAGKSSLLNALAGQETAIVTDIEGTTRDTLKEHIQIDGMPLHIIDTAGLRDSEDAVEKIGISRAWTEIEQADRILLVFAADSANDQQLSELRDSFIKRLPDSSHITFVRNKVDLTGESPAVKQLMGHPCVSISASTNLGIDLLKEHLKECVGFASSSEGIFAARRRHIQALEDALDAIHQGKQQLIVNNAPELLAEDLRIAQEALGKITGKFSPDDLLGEIFSSFCIGK